MCKVSILVPIYNVEKYLRQCLDSVVNQTLQDIEIICINDGSTDSSPAIINEYAAKDSRIKVINKPNSGYGHSMNQGLKLAQGEYIGIVESDDFADSNMFEVLYDKAITSNADIVKANYWTQVSDIKLFKNLLDGEPYNEVFDPQSRAKTIFNRPVAVWSAIYRREHLLKNGIYFNETPGASYQDVAFSFKAISSAERMLLIKDAFLHYRVDNPGASMRSKTKVYCIFDEFAEIDKFLSAHEELCDPFKYALIPFKFNQCNSHFIHIGNEFRLDFLHRVLEEFDNDDTVKYLNNTYWKEDRWQAFQELLNHKEAFFYHQYETLQRKQTYIDDILSKLQSFKNIYIYGAGRRATFTMLYLLRKNLKIKNILVSSKDKNSDKMFNISVIEFDSATLDKEHDAILLAIKEEQQYNIFYQLKNEGYKNVMLITAELRSTFDYSFD